MTQVKEVEKDGVVDDRQTLPIPAYQAPVDNANP